MQDIKEIKKEFEDIFTHDDCVWTKGKEPLPWHKDVIWDFFLPYLKPTKENNAHNKSNR